MPHKLHSGITYDSGDFAAVMDECLKLADWNGFAEARGANRKKNGKLRGRGIGYFLEEAAIFNERMVIRFDPSGTLTILAGTHSHGQGHQTVYAQMVHEWLGVPFESISFIQGDTDEVRSAAAPTARAACMSAATRLNARPTPSSRRQSRWRQ